MGPNGRWAWLPVTPTELAVAGALVSIAAAAWVSTILRMAGMDAGHWSYPTDLALYAGTWVAMMTAMMLPAIVPTVLVYGRAVRSHRGRRTAFATTAAFVGGYLAIWGAAGLIPYALLGAAGAPVPGGAASRYLAAGVLLAAAAYQLAPPKRACLRGLCAPLPPVMDAGHLGGGLGALRAGLESAGRCLGCCWALMASLFALGVMSVTWMILIWILVMAERLLPSRRLATVGVAFVLAALAAGVLVGA
jgi:predicted metal-binding membrane protein